MPVNDHKGVESLANTATEIAFGCGASDYSNEEIEAKLLEYFNKALAWDRLFDSEAHNAYEEMEATLAKALKENQVKADERYLRREAMARDLRAWASSYVEADDEIDNEDVCQDIKFVMMNHLEELANVSAYLESYLAAL